MNGLQTDLVREKFVIGAPDGVQDAQTSIVVLSNRIEITLAEKPADKYVIRAQNMHICVRLAAAILGAVKRGGPLSLRLNTFDWEPLWYSIYNAYERAYNPDLWARVYLDGKAIFQHGATHPFLDLIEKCDANSDESYDLSVGVAENILGQNGNKVAITYDAITALTVLFEKGAYRSGLILRAPEKTTIFSYKVFQKKNDGAAPVSLPQCLYSSAAFLEGVQMAFMVGRNDDLHNHKELIAGSDAYKQDKEARKRLAVLNTEIRNLQNSFKITYRPEKPEFLLLSEAARLHAAKLRNT